MEKVIIINSKYLVLTILIFTFLWSCEESVDPHTDTELYPDLGLTQEDSLEAEIIAYYLDQSLTALDSSLKRELYLLNFLREAFRDSFPFVDSLRFFTPWEFNTIIVGAEDSVLAQIQNNTFHAWGSIEPGMRPDSVRLYSSLGAGLFYLKPGYHPVLLSEYYNELPGVRYAEANVYGYVFGPYFPLAINRSDSSNLYLFSLFSFPSPNPYTHYLFNYVNDQPNYLGSSAEMSNTEYYEFINEFVSLGFP